MPFKRLLTPEQHTLLIEQAKKGVKLKRLARDFGLAGPSSAFRYKYTKPYPIDSEHDAAIISQSEAQQSENSSDMQEQPESTDIRDVA